MKQSILCFLVLFGLWSVAQKKSDPVYVDGNGVMRWTKDRSEASFFGVNYTVPFAYGYRSHKALGADIEKAIDADVYHMKRLGLDAFRVHVWDVEISDSLGNLLQNEHLRLFDYLLSKLEANGIHIALRGFNGPPNLPTILCTRLMGIPNIKHIISTWRIRLPRLSAC